jgi:hypothetical protein
MFNIQIKYEVYCLLQYLREQNVYLHLMDMQQTKSDAARNLTVPSIKKP